MVNSNYLTDEEEELSQQCLCNNAKSLVDTLLLLTCIFEEFQIKD